MKERVFSFEMQGGLYNLSKSDAKEQKLSFVLSIIGYESNRIIDVVSSVRDKNPIGRNMNFPEDEFNLSD